MDTQAATPTSLRELCSIVGPEHAWQAHDDRRFAGGPARFVVEPGTVEETAAVMALAYREAWHVYLHGHGSKRGWGGTGRDVDLVVITGRLNRVIEHAADDLIVRVESGVTLAALQVELAASGQMLALNPPEPQATIGGILATNATGYRRQRYGTARDLIIGITVVLADGTIAKAGGKVVKNVAGYDLAKLFTGSLGTLGIIVEATFRLHPRPTARQTVMLDLRSPSDTGAALQALRDSRRPFVYEALELQWTIAGGRLVALFEGTEPGVVAQANEAIDILAPIGKARLVAGEDEDVLWSDLAGRPWTEGLAEECSIGMKMSVPPAAIGGAVSETVRLTSQHDASYALKGHAGAGVLYLGAQSGSVETLIELLADLRAYAMREGGSLVVPYAHPEIAARIDRWGPIGDALPLMYRIKTQFDPLGLLNPGLFAGGI